MKHISKCIMIILSKYQSVQVPYYWANPSYIFSQSYYNGSQQDFIKSSEFETSCNEMINIHPYSGPAVKSEKLESYEEMPVPQALSSSSSFATQDFSTSSANDDTKK